MIDLIHGDCRDILKTFSDCSIDLVVTDPPYKMNHSTGGCTNIGMKNKWNGNIKAGNTVMDFDTSIEFSEWIPEIYRVLKDKCNAYIFVNDKNMQELLNVALNVGFKLSNILIWQKNNATPNRYYMKSCEFVVFLYKTNARVINNMGTKTLSLVKNISGKNKLHPTEKPIELLEQYITNSSNEGDWILDPFFGSCSTGKACQNTNRNFYGIEKMLKHFLVGQDRINNTDEKEKVLW